MRQGIDCVCSVHRRVDARHHHPRRQAAGYARMPRPHWAAVGACSLIYRAQLLPVA